MLYLILSDPTDYPTRIVILSERSESKNLSARIHAPRRPSPPPILRVLCDPCVKTNYSSLSVIKLCAEQAHSGYSSLSIRNISPNPFRMTSFADPHHLTSFATHRCQTRAGGGSFLFAL